MSDAADVVRRYFEAVRGADLDALCDLFHSEARISVGGGEHSGIAEIRAFYARALAVDPPSPSPGQLLVDGGTVAVEIVNHRASGPVELADFFHVEDGRIRRLRAYYAPRGSQQANGAQDT